MHLFELQRVLAQVKKQYPEIDDDEARDIAREWCDELAQEAAERYDTDCIEDHMPAEYFTERG